jgi:hypothetical protein
VSLPPEFGLKYSKDQLEGMINKRQRQAFVFELNSNGMMKKSMRAYF